MSHPYSHYQESAAYLRAQLGEFVPKVALILGTGLGELAQEVAQRMAQVGLVDDREYASTVVRHYSRKGYGPAKIRDELYRRGVPREFWHEAMEERDQGDDKLRALVEKKLRGAQPTREELKKVSAYLGRRGFGWEEISRVLSQVEQEAE